MTGALVKDDSYAVGTTIIPREPMRLKQQHVFYQGNQGIWIIGAARQACSVRVRSVRDLHVERCTL